MSLRNILMVLLIALCGPSVGGGQASKARPDRAGETSGGSDKPVRYGPRAVAEYESERLIFVDEEGKIKKEISL